MLIILQSLVLVSKIAQFSSYAAGLLRFFIHTKKYPLCYSETALPQTPSILDHLEISWLEQTFKSSPRLEIDAQSFLVAQAEVNAVEPRFTFPSGIFLGKNRKCFVFVSDISDD